MLQLRRNKGERSRAARGWAGSKMGNRQGDAAPFGRVRTESHSNGYQRISKTRDRRWILKHQALPLVAVYHRPCPFGFLIIS